ncbi:putative odorant receptor 83c [Aedes albopictus]|uniref:Odorant receptor n=1 Tax=Aedes albopictus TaxID=7160 RepID=A0ABM1XY78_AEDAL
MVLRSILKRHFVVFEDDALSRIHGVDVYHGLIVRLRWQLRAVGYDVLKIPFKYGKMTAFSSLCLLLFIAFTGYTVVLHWGDWFQVIDTLSLLGMGSSSVAKALTGLLNYEYYQKNYRILTALYRSNDKHKDNNRRLVYWGMLITYYYRFFLVISVSGGFGFVLTPVFTYFWYNERMLIINLHIPGVDTVTRTGFMITTLFHLVLIFMAVAGILAADLGCIIVVGHVAGIADVFKNALNELDQLTKQKCDERVDDSIHRKVLQICVMHQEIISYEEELDENYGVTVFVQVLSSIACVALSLFNFYMTYNIGALTFLVYAFFQLFQYCVLGTVLTIKNDEIMIALYDTYWYKLTNTEQKMIGYMLHRSQNAVEMTIGGISLLNMETFVEIVKTIYSYSAMLVQFLD